MTRPVWLFVSPAGSSVVTSPISKLEKWQTLGLFASVTLMPGLLCSLDFHFYLMIPSWPSPSNQTCWTYTTHSGVAGNIFYPHTCHSEYKTWFEVKIHEDLWFFCTGDWLP